MNFQERTPASRMILVIEFERRSAITTMRPLECREKSMLRGDGGSSFALMNLELFVEHYRRLALGQGQGLVAERHRRVGFVASFGGYGLINRRRLRRHDRHFFPVRADSYVLPAATAARHAWRKRRQFNRIRIVVHTHCRLVVAFRIDADQQQPANAKLPQVADRHR
jgi:hypothetical protein